MLNAHAANYAIDGTGMSQASTIFISKENEFKEWSSHQMRITAGPLPWLPKPIMSNPSYDNPSILETAILTDKENNPLGSSPEHAEFYHAKPKLLQKHNIRI